MTEKDETTAAPAPSYASSARVQALCGPVGCGKTEALVGEVARALAGGAAPEDVLVVACRATAADELVARLARACGEAAARVRVTTPVELALGVLATPAARAATGRRAHVLTDVENTFFIEDMRVTGIKGRRLRELLKFLYRGWSELREDEPDWLITVEETTVNDLAKSRLSLLQALHPAEVTAVAARYLAADPAARARATRRLVFADDYRSMSRASQMLLAMVAGEGLTVVWDANAALPGEEPYAYAGGLAELADANPGMGRRGFTEPRRAAGLARVTNNLLSQRHLSSPVKVDESACAANPGEALEVLVADELADEPASVARRVAAAVPSVGADGVFVACPTDAWVRRMAAALRAEGLPVSALAGRQAVGGDIRSLADSSEAQAACALLLAAEPDSPLAWRCWCGFGDYLASSAGMNALYERAKEQGAGLVDVLTEALAEKGADAGLVGLERIAGRVREARAFLEQARGLAGDDLLACACRAAGADGGACATVQGLLGQVAAGEDAASLAARLERALRAPTFAPGAVRVGRLEALAGQAPAVLVVCGLANGLVPAHAYFDLSEASKDEQDKMHARLIDLLVEATGKARDALVCSTFARAGVEEAERLHLAAARLRLRDGRRVCDMAPSVCLAFMRGEALDKPVF